MVADFPLILEAGEWNAVAIAAEQLSTEVLDAERELLTRPDLHRRLGLPRAICKVLRAVTHENVANGAARIMRFDFHFTPDGWRISEVNADVPGGFIEASGFTELMADCYPSYTTPKNPANAYLDAIVNAAGEGRLVGLAHATAHYDDRQVMQYLAEGLHRRGMRTLLLSPAHLEWQSGFARTTGPFGKSPVDLLVRFFPAEWLPNLRRRSLWEPWFCAGKTAMSNPGIALFGQSKRFPLVWP